MDQIVRSRTGMIYTNGGMTSKHIREAIGEALYFRNSELLRVA
jgi:hypothetical protein